MYKMLRKGVVSFATHPKAKYWDYEKNILKPEDVALNSSKKFWFICGDCNHDFDTPPLKLT